MSTDTRHPRRAANHIRIYTAVVMTTCLHFAMKNFKKSGSSAYPPTTASAILFYSIAIPLAHMAQLELVYARASEMRVLRLSVYPKSIVYALAAGAVMLFVGPGIYAVYSLLGMGPVSQSSLNLAYWVLEWGATTLVAVDILAILIAFAMFATYTSYIEGRYRRTVSLCLVFTSTAMLANTFWLTQMPSRSWSIQEFVENILKTNPSLFVAFLLVIIVSRLVESSDRPPQEL
ncbi:hypothetical protein M408DRAFT_331300, partial [Serendipita vermifera MAFF 305830]